MLAVQNIHKTYEEQPLLRGVSFELKKEETICLLGPSGSGKSTLLRIIAGLEQAESGQIRWLGQDMTQVPPHQRNFGLMFQDYALFPHRTVAENIAFGLRMQNRPQGDIQQRVKEALNTINMSRFADRKVTELSGGEQQRVALARALAPQPRLLMLDEPLGALDRTLREQLSQELRRILHETKIPAIYVTHDQEEAFAIADRLLLLHNGVILQSGRPHDFYHHPRNVWVADFFGLGNLVSGVVEGHNPLQVRTPLGLIHASCDGQTPEVGQPTTLLFRPGQACQGEGNCNNLIQGTVLDQVFQGETYRITIKVSPESPYFQVHLPNPVEIDQSLDLGYHTKDVLCLQQDESNP
jgi:ABC-type Fe3+/spermidine/putrescine transport system ATPase subunit